MSEQDIEQIALEWAMDVKNTHKDFLDEADIVVADYILSQLQPTMADVEFDSAEHTLAGVTHKSGSNHILWEEVDDYYVNTVSPDGTLYRSVRKDLTLNGKRYRIQEVDTSGVKEDGATVSSDEKVGDDQPEHPEILTSLSEYSNAPSGTIVFASDSLPLVKMRSGDWAAGVSQYPVKSVAGISRKVARWGWKL